MTPAMQKEVEKHFTRGELRRVAGERGRRAILSGPRARELRERSARHARRRGDPRARLPDRRRLRLLGLVVRAAARARPARRRGGRRARLPERRRRGPRAGLRASIGQAKRLVSGGRRRPRRASSTAPASGSTSSTSRPRDSGRAGAAPLPPPDRARTAAHGKLAFPVTVTSQVDRLVEGTGSRSSARPRRCPTLTAGRGRGRRRSSPARSAAATSSRTSCPPTTPWRASRSCSSCSPPVDRPLSELVAELPEPTLVHRQLACPWALKGLVMRVLNERLAGREVDLTDGIKVFDERGWAQVLPDPDEPLIHLYAEGETAEELRGARGRAPRDRRGDRAGREPPRPRSLKLGLTSAAAAKAKVHLDPLEDERCAWNRFLISHRCPTPTSKELIDELTQEEQRGLVPAPHPARQDRHPARGARRAAAEDGGPQRPRPRGRRGADGDPRREGTPASE